jgi:hypothetical protein
MKPVSIISIIYGTLGIAWGSMISVLIRFQTSILSNIPLPDEAISIVDVPKLFTVLNDTWRLLFPFIFVIGTIYIISGILNLAGRQQYLALAYIAAILNIIWYLVYMIMIQTEILPLINLDQFIPKNLFNILVGIGMVGDAVFYCGYPVFLIIFLSQQKGGRQG